MAATDDNQHDFGITVPPLVDYLKTILREYSDGQIIKELVQNAEDAGADTVKFLYEVRQYGTETLYKSSLAPYQGPAFYSFNNAKFKKADWDGIQTPARSIKKTDRLKVGRFGIGFNSVYHITDLPSIMSDQTLAFIDPLEEHFLDQRGRIKTGWRFGLSSDGDTFLRCEDQFEPYRNIFPGVTGGISTGQLDGTLFRFPLRPTANELSDKTYNDEVKMDELLQAFRVDADVVMLFLRGLNNIEVLKRPSGQQEPSLVVRVQREHDQDPQAEDFSSRLQSYCSAVRGDRGPIEMTNSVTFATEAHETLKTQRWVVSHLIAGDRMSSELSDLAEKQSHLPWVAVAIPMNSSEPSTAACEAENPNIGRVFCFLPLPPGEESRTNLPVHIHGFFGVNSDRRGIKWPGPDQTDIPAQWNRLLVSELIPIVYVNAIKYAISIHTSQEGVTTDCIYRSWPDHKMVHGNWNILLEPLYNALFREAIIHSDNNGWKNIADIHFNELTVGGEMEKAILKCFNLRGIAHANVPPVCRQAIKKFYKDQTSIVSASSLCRCIREDPSILTKLNTEEKLLILEFILSEDAEQDLQGLPLLPLDDDSFHIFSSSEETVYVPTSQFHRQLVPGGYQQFIRTIPKEQPLHQLLSKMDGRYQLKTLTLDAVAQLLKTTMKTWIDDQGTWVQDTRRSPSLNAWLEEVWSMLYRECSSKLLLFEGIPLVPLIEARGEFERLLPLLPNSKVIQRSHRTSDSNLPLTNGVESVLQQLGVTVTDCPEYLLSHPAVMRDEYIKMPTPEGIVKCLLLSDIDLLVEKVKSFSSSNRDILIENLSQAKLSKDGKELVRCLPLFERVSGTGSSAELLVSIGKWGKCKGYIDCSQTVIPEPLKLTGLLIEGGAKSKSLLQKLEVNGLSKYQVIMDVLNEIDNGQLYTVPEKQLVLQWIMKRWQEININCKSSKDILRRLKFIPNLEESLMSPHELLDPRDPLLQKLFASQGLFPVAPFDSAHVIAAFKQLGMRGQNEVTTRELIACVEMVEESQSPEKARALLELLTRNQILLQSFVTDCMKWKQVIPCRQSPPEYYPSGIDWYGNFCSRLSTPLEILREKKQAVLLCGASKSFTSKEDENRFSVVYTKMGMTFPSSTLSDVMTQFGNCVGYTEDRTGQDVTAVVPMLKEIYSFLREAWRLDSNVKNIILNRAKVFIWNGSGFSEPTKMCTGKLPFDLAPYMASIPQSVSAFADLFEALGVEKNMESNKDAFVEILHEIKDRCDDPEPNVAFKQRQRRLVLQILHQLQATGELSEEAQGRVLVPSHKEACRLIPVEESAYVDRDWMRQSTDHEEMDDDEDFTLIHPDISMDLARFLHVRPVSRLLLDSENFEGFIQAGQQEPLTTRLWNILQNNYTRTSIAKEMVQNAEDAGAHEVRFLIDMRKNENAKEKLFDPGMKSCQGPALWVYNDAVFTDEDFKNILSLGGRTKEKDTEKIGKFGTGFNSVYHITDVPSFVSREYMQFFDPHTTHLGNVLPNKSQPGVRLKLNSTKQLRRFPDQFKPFNGVFGLDFNRGNEPFDYHGTLFRLPLRSKEAAQKSQICKESYDVEKVMSLMHQMWESSQNLLVFTKKVKKVSLFYLTENSSDPTTAEELFTIQKTVRPPTTKGDDTVISTESFRQSVTSKGAELFSQIQETAIQANIGTVDTLKVVCKTSKQASAVAQSQEGKSHGLSPEGAVAFPFNITSLPKVKGEIYCGLPLSLPSCLPVHINGSFAINEDRRSLRSPTPDGMTISERWNHILLSEVICRAYVSLLSDKEFIQQIRNTYGADVSPESFWPDVDELSENSECSKLFDAFYNAIVHGLDGNRPAILWNGDKPHQFHNVVFLSQNLQKEKEIKESSVKVLTTYVKEHIGSLVEVIELSEKTWKAFERSGVHDEVHSRTYDLNRFFDEVFLPQVDEVSQDMRDHLVRFALHTTEGNLHEKLKDVKCIPVVGESDLKRPCDLMHPDDPILYELFASKGVFPDAPFDSTHLIPAFKVLGMRGQNEVTSVELLACVDMIEESQSHTKAQALLRLLDNNPNHFLNTHSGCTVADSMKYKRCIPCRKSPPDYYPPDIEWHGRTSSCLSTPKEVLIETKKTLLISGASRSFISQQDCLFSTAFRELGITCNTPILSDVIAQLENCVRYTTYRPEQDVTDIIPMLKEIYSFLMDAWHRNSNVINLILDRTAYCIWNGNGFSEPSKMCTGKLPFDLAPYMASIPLPTCSFKDMFEALGVKRNMDTNSDALVEVLHEIKRRCDDPGANVAFKQRQRQLVLQILHHLHATGELSEYSRGRLLVPSHKEACRLIPVEESAYVDRDWMRQNTDNEEMDDDEDFSLIHPDISMDLARFLHVRPVSRLLLDSELLEGFTQAGQQEQLTMRLYNILKNNYFNTAIVNEMIQNAEDAGAQEVRFLIDMRKNENSNEKLFDPGMKSCQGPALWVYNDAVFTDEDFENILRLGGRTKEKNTEKIGKFGTGFNSVYHITDVPSFVSGKYMQFFDPHTTHLGNVLPNKSQPGVRLKLNSTKQLRRFPDQFKPFNGVFGLDFNRENEPFDYYGTLFRLPLRTKEAAQKSQICKESYDGKKLISLMQKMWESSQDLLVFTRKITKVAVFYLGEHTTDPSEAEELFTIEKTVDSTRLKEDGTVISTDSIRCTITSKGHAVVPQAQGVNGHLTTVRVLCKTSQEAASLAQSPDGKECGLLPEGAVAFPLHRKPISAFKKQLYCFLPLSITSTFPVHINGSFAVKEDRRSLVTTGGLISQKWNHVLLADVICRAYVSLLSDNGFIQQVKHTYGSEFSPESLWPDIDEVPKNSECSALFDAFYKAMVHGLDGNEPSLFWKDGKAHHFTKVVFLGEQVQKEKSVCDVVMKVLQDYLASVEVMTLTEKTWRAVDRVGLRNEVIMRTYDFDRFFDEVFLPQISRVPGDMRNQLVLFALNIRGGELKQKLKDFECIPVVGETELRKPCDLVHPKGEAAHLYSESDGVFPLGEKFNSSDTLASLSQLGMIEHSLSEDTFVKRCETVHNLHSSSPRMAQKRCYAVLKYLSESLWKRHWNEKEGLKVRLECIPLLPILSERNRDTALPWLETDFSSAYMSATDVYSHSRKYLVSSRSNVVDKTKDWQLPKNVEDFLGLANKYPSVQEVLRQLTNFRNHYEMNNEYISDGPLELICIEVYKRIEMACKENCPEIINEELQDQRLFLVDRKFLLARKIAEGGLDLPPYLFKASPFLKQFPYLMKRASMKSAFDDGDYHEVLHSIYEGNSGHCLDKQVLEVAILAADRLSSFVNDDESHPLDAFLPDEHGYMRPVSELCYSDIDWFEYDTIQLRRCHMNISFMLAKKLKVKDIRQQMLRSYDMNFPGEEFGQHEKLTTRIKRILESYPSDETILKELLQNADDAGATEIHFVYDPRSHDGKKILGDGMKSLQGPALCVFNNQSFTDEDIRGIQNLGEGSKADHMGKIGRYGVGFNAVYQLTDCPSFISNGEKLCMFDPLLEYVPGATPNKPGRQIRVDDNVRCSYPDVFPCYLEDKLADGQQDFTVFRFPLREKASNLSRTVWRAMEIRKLLKDFETAAFESLLFLKNITKISISEVTRSGAVDSTQTICAEITAIESEKKTDFLQKVQDFVSASQSNSDIEPEPAEVIYEMKLKGPRKEEDWVICQQVGSANMDEESSMRKYKLLPVGAVAARLTDTKRELEGKAFCFLPLPIKTGLPVHVHGYFALDHESRRHLWEGTTTDEQTNWNCHITQHVIAPAYVKLLLWVKEFFVKEYEWSGSMTCEKTLRTLLQKYHTFFPLVDDKGFYWSKLLHTVYEVVAKEALTLFPSIYREYDGQAEFSLKWKTPMQSPGELDMGYFNTLQNQMSDQYVSHTNSPSYQSQKQENINQLRDTLIEITFPLLESPTRIMGRLRNACKHLNNETTQYEVLEVSPSNVISFLRNDNPLQRQLPMTLSKSRIYREERLTSLINYCKKVEKPKISDTLHGLPLLLTEDGILRKFLHDEPVFVSEYYDLFKDQSHRFLHKGFLYTLPRKADVFCELDVSAVSVLLHDCTPFLECGSDEIIPLKKHLSPEWFGRLWSLFESFCKEKKNLLDIANDIRAKLSHWAILPVTQTQTQHCKRSYPNQAIKQVAPISLSSTIIIQPVYSEKGCWTIYSVLESLNVYKVERSTFHEDNYRLIQHLVTHKDGNFKVLDVLMYWVDRDSQRFLNLKPGQHEKILEHFRYCDNSSILTRLKGLPCFKSIGDDFVSITGCDKVLVLPSRIPKKEQNTWVSTTNAIFLQYNVSLEDLYKRLGLANTTEIEVYAQYILPAFDRLSEDSRLEHLVRLKHLLEQLHDYESRMSRAELKEVAISRLGLRQLRFITGLNGELRKTADFYDPEKEIFSLMLSKNHFPPERIVESLGLQFLREIGLQVDVTRDLFLTFAKQVHESHSDHKMMKRRSLALVRELRLRCELHSDPYFLQLVSEVDFLVSDQISREMESLHPPFMKAGTLTSYSRSTSFKHKKLIWSTNSILPEYAGISGKCTSCKTTFGDKMGVTTEPDLMSVIKHSRNICNRLDQRNDKKLSFPEELVSVLQATFTFLSSKCTGQGCSHEEPCERCCTVRAELQDVPIVFLDLEDEHRLVKAEQISRTIEENLEPFLYQLQDRWVPYFNFFRVLGGTVKPSLGQYSFVLESIFNRGQSAWSNPNVVNVVDRATCGLYQELIKTDTTQVAAAFVTRHSLYLPSCQNTLTRSDHLLVNDVDHYTNRLSRSKLPLIKIFPNHERIARDAIAKLPENMKPKAVSIEVRERLSKTGNDSRECLMNGDAPCEFKRRLQVLQSREFLNAVCCVMKHNKKTVDEDTKQEFKDRLLRLKITCMQRLHSILQINGKDIEGSETEVPSFINDDNELFVQHSEADNIMETLLSVAIHVNQVLGNIFEDRNFMSILLSQESPATIPKVLAKFSIAVEMPEEDTSFQLPPPGSTIPEQLYHLIEQDPWTSFSTGDYVAYAQTGEDGDYYVYALVVKKIRNDSSKLKALYRIDIGTGSHIEANILDIHKIHIPESILGKELVPSENGSAGKAEPRHADHHQSSISPDVEEAKRQVTTELEEIWQLPEEQKRKALRRLMLKWHPDKHPEGPKELFDEAFKHLQSEMQRLEKGLSGTSTQYEDIFRAANQRARADRERYTHFGGFTSGFWRGGRGGGFGSGNWSSGSSFNQFFTSAPDIRNARRWLRQGQEDLCAARHDLDPQDEPSREWVAQKCHQSVEKALKAVQIAITGCSGLTHSLPNLAGDVSDHFKTSPGFLENVSHLSSLAPYLRARYPDSCASAEIPHEAFRDKAKAEEMIRLAHSILGEVQAFVQSH